MPQPEPMPPASQATSGDTSDGITTSALLWQQFGARLITLEEVRKAYFRNRSAARFRRALREGTIPLPVVRLDASTKGQGYICLFQLAAYIDWHARQAALHQEAEDCSVLHSHRLHRALIEAVPVTDFAGTAS